MADGSWGVLEEEKFDTTDEENTENEGLIGDGVSAPPGYGDKSGGEKSGGEKSGGEKSAKSGGKSGAERSGGEGVSGEEEKAQMGTVIIAPPTGASKASMGTMPKRKIFDFTGALRASQMGSVPRWNFV